MGARWCQWVDATTEVFGTQRALLQREMVLGLARFDAIVSDLRMPGGDGAPLWRSLRRYHPALARRLLFVTGDTLSPASQAFLASTGCPGLDKPFTQAVLQAAVARLLAAP